MDTGYSEPNTLVRVHYMVAALVAALRTAIHPAMPDECAGGVAALAVRLGLYIARNAQCSCQSC